MNDLSVEDVRAIDCAILHFRTFMDQAAENVQADFGEPCRICKHVGECKLDWLITMEPILRHTSIPIFSREHHGATASQ